MSKNKKSWMIILHCLEFTLPLQPFSETTNTKYMAKSDNTHTTQAWTEVEYTALCKHPYLSTPFFIPKEAKCYLCHTDGTREEQRMIFLVFKSISAPAEAEWEDDPTPGELWVQPLGDDDETIKPAKVIYLGQDIEDFIHVEHEDDQNIIFDIYWRHGDVKVEKAEKTDEGFMCRKDDFGDDGLTLTLIPENEGNPFTMQLQIPYLGFSLYDNEGNKQYNSVSIPHDHVDNYTYDFVGDEGNDRFSLHLDGDRLIYMCVLRHEDGKLVVRDQRERLAVVNQIPTEGKLSELMMGAHEALVKNKSRRWRITIEGTSKMSGTELSANPKVLIDFVKNELTKGIDANEFGQHLMTLEKKFFFQWFWLKDSDWNENADPQLDMFMRQLCAFSYISQKPIQGDPLATRNNKRKIRRCANMVKAHQCGELNLWDKPEVERKEILHFFSTFHQPFIEELEKDDEE